MTRYSLLAVLNLTDPYLSRFLEVLKIGEWYRYDYRGEVAVRLFKLDLLEYPAPITNECLEVLLEMTSGMCGEQRLLMIISIIDGNSNIPRYHIRNIMSLDAVQVTEFKEYLQLGLSLGLDVVIERLLAIGDVAYPGMHQEDINNMICPDIIDDVFNKERIYELSNSIIEPATDRYEFMVQIMALYGII